MSTLFLEPGPAAWYTSITSSCWEACCSRALLVSTMSQAPGSAAQRQHCLGLLGQVVQQGIRGDHHLLALSAAALWQRCFVLLNPCNRAFLMRTTSLPTWSCFTMQPPRLPNANWSPSDGEMYSAECWPENAAQGEAGEAWTTPPGWVPGSCQIALPMQVAGQHWRGRQDLDVSQPFACIASARAPLLKCNLSGQAGMISVCGLAGPCCCHEGSAHMAKQ